MHENRNSLQGSVAEYGQLQPTALRPTIEIARKVKVFGSVGSDFSSRWTRIPRPSDKQNKTYGSGF